ncbi:tyrosine-type recombinase/integrase [Pseudomonas sp. PA1(2017)]|uniref:tyrosine-type recombinase/integrase n=1 Tax=Pseudomonas sp. PA1(2017) TaxID=1932113 RepID=UPI0035323B34
MSEALELRWEDINWGQRSAHVRRTVALGQEEERTKTGHERFVLLNQRALRALWFAKAYADRRLLGIGRIKSTHYIFPPSKGQEYVRLTSDIHYKWRPTLNDLGIRYRRPYNCRHTYATICLMTDMKPAFIAQQLGHSVQMLLSTYARRINSTSDWGEMSKLDIGIKSVSIQETRS